LSVDHFGNQGEDNDAPRHNSQRTGAASIMVASKWFERPSRMAMKQRPNKCGKQRSISKEKNAVMTSAHVFFGPTSVTDKKHIGSTYNWLAAFEEEGGGRRFLTFEGS
jgi:hypothetical protein